VKSKTTRSLLCVTGALLLASCGTPADQSASPAVGGTLVISTVADADLLLPPLALTGQALQITDQLFDRLVQPAMDGAGTLTYAPALATRWTWRADSLAIDFTLAESARWHDGQPVTAEDVRFSFAAYADSTLGSPAREALRDIDSVQVTGPHAVRVWFARRGPSQFSDAAAQVRVLPKHLLDSLPRASWRASAFARRPVGSGRFRFGSWQAGTRIELITDSANYRGRAKLDRVVWTIAPDPAAAMLRLTSGDADFLEGVRPDGVPELAKHPNVRVLRSPGLAYGYLQFNLMAPRSATAPHPLFGQRELRRALSAGVNRALAVQQVLGSEARVALGPVTRIQLGADTLLPAIAFDTLRANTVLDSLGWVRGANGVRAKAGAPLRFALLVPGSSTQRVRLAEVLQPLFKGIGVDAQITSLEFGAFMGRLAAGDFDAAIMALGADPDLGGIRGVWGSDASRLQGGPNFGLYASAAFDSAVTTALRTTDAVAARKAFLPAYRIILDDAPAIWLFEPYTLSGVSTAITTVGVRPDAWWAQLADWTRTPVTAKR
jgi:peptide/nickel transport system substrate-binding protein